MPNNFVKVIKAEFMLWKRIKNFVGFDDHRLSLENKLFNAVCLTVGFAMLIGLAVNVLLGFPIGLIIVQLFIGALSAFAVHHSRYHGYNENMALVYIAAGIIFSRVQMSLTDSAPGASAMTGVFFIVLIMIMV